MLWAGAITLAPFGISSNGAAPIGQFTARLAYLAGAVICHQRPDRSFTWAGQPWPVCARCAGIYLGAAAMALLFLSVGPRDSRFLPAPGSGADGASARLAVGVAVLPAGLSLLWEWATGQTPPNLVRALTGALIGAVVTWVVMRAFRAEHALGVN